MGLYKYKDIFVLDFEKVKVDRWNSARQGDEVVMKLCKIPGEQTTWLPTNFNWIICKCNHGLQ